jgi:hypothetical protein
MNPALRAKAMLVDPAAEWIEIERESGDPAYLLSRYVALLALVPALSGFIGTSLIGVVVPGPGVVRASLFDAIFGAIFGYVLAFATVLVLGFVINTLAPAFGGQKNFGNAFKLAVYSFTPAWLAGIFLILPGLRFLVLTGFFGAYVLWLGLPRLMKAPPQRSLGYVFAVVACAGVLAYSAAAAQRAVFGTPGL